MTTLLVIDIDARPRLAALHPPARPRGLPDIAAMSQPATLPLCVYRGDTLRWQMRLWTDEAMTTPIDLATATASAQIRDKPGGNLACTIELVVTLPNIIDATLTAAEAAKAPSRGAWDLQLTWSGGDVTTLLAGPVTTQGDVTTTAAAMRAKLGAVA